MRKDLINGRILNTLVIYSIPLIVTNVVQILFHAADVAILSLMAGDLSVAAVGACGSLITLLVSLCSGFATGANILIAKRIGSKDETGVRRAVGTALVVGFCAGLFLMTVALIFAKRLLILMQCQPDVLDMAVLYMKIYFLGMPFTMLYNFVAAILRASGDSVRPMAYMLISGVLNVILNVLFVGVLDLTVAGVAIATVLSNVTSLVMGLTALIRNHGICKIELRQLRIRRLEFFEMLKIGVPASSGGLCFYVSNVIISSTVNSMSTEVMTANAIAGQFDGFVYTVGNAIALATMTMVGQNFGAGRFDRIRKTVKTSALYATAVSLSLGFVFVLLAETLLNIMTDSAAVVSIAKERMIFLCLTYFITGIMEVLSFTLHALRRQKYVLIVCAVCGFGVRSCWVWFVWPLHQTLSMLFASYAVSALIAILFYVFMYRSTMREYERDSAYISQS
ncbi:MAG: MATE family efflux transporter [Clostridia bacterium]|nr:MATE family efflux transporter [Clostridia bacterium]